MTYINAFLKYKDPETLSIEDLKNIPLINIIVPAWKEGEIFRQCLNSITKLKYPKIKAIINAGGSNECLEIAKSFKKFNNFIILEQKGGGNRAELGKLKALNESLDYVSEGLLYFVDADVYITDEVLLRIIYPIVNLNEDIVTAGIKPLKHQEQNDFVKYLHFNQNLVFNYKFNRYSQRQIGGANTCITYEAMKRIGRFTQNRIDAEDISRGEDILQKGFKIYCLTDYRAALYSYTADKFKIYAKQKIRWIENNIIYAYQNKRYISLMKIGLIFFFSYYLLIFPFLFLFSVGFVYIGILVIWSLYLKKLRRIIFWRKCFERKYHQELSILFFFKLIYYLYIEAIINILIPIDFILFLKRVRTKKEIL